MKFQKLFLVALATSFIMLSSCKKKKDDEATPRTFSFDISNDLNVTMTWTVNGQTAGNSYVDLDLYIDDTLTSGATDFGSTSGSSFESTIIPKSTTSMPNKSYYLGVMYYSNEQTLANPSTINYTITITPGTNTALTQTITGSFTYPSTSSSYTKVFYKYKIVKTANGFEFIENPFEKIYNWS